MFYGCEEWRKRDEVLNIENLGWNEEWEIKWTGRKEWKEVKDPSTQRRRTSEVKKRRRIKGCKRSGRSVINYVAVDYTQAMKWMEEGVKIMDGDQEEDLYLMADEREEMMEINGKMMFKSSVVRNADI